MNLRKITSCLAMLITIAAHAQTNFTYSPDKPKAGDLITITYEPAGDIANTLSPVEGVAYQLNNAGVKAFDINFTKSNGKLTGTVQTDTAGTFVYFGFS